MAESKYDRIQQAEKKAQLSRVPGPALCTVSFNRGTDCLASFEAEGAIHIPAVGDTVMVHNEYVSVTEVDVAYEVIEEMGVVRNAVYATIEVN